jgi:hypothetical protein
MYGPMNVEKRTLSSYVNNGKGRTEVNRGGGVASATCPARLGMSGTITLLFMCHCGLLGEIFTFIRCTGVSLSFVFLHTANYLSGFT